MFAIFQRLKNFFFLKKNNSEVKDFSNVELFSEIEKLIDSPINNKAYYIQALIHRSFLDKNGDTKSSNERMEFLGDAVLNLVVANFLFDYFSDKDEGFLTKVRSKMVNRRIISDCAEKLKLNEFLFISKSVADKSDRGVKTIQSDAFEALVGAIYLDLGLESCKKFIRKILIEPFISSGEYLLDHNYKSQLLEYTQSQKLDLPVYKIISEEGPQHDRTFTIEVRVGGNLKGIGIGKNKKSAEQEAAKNLLKSIPHKEQQI